MSMEKEKWKEEVIESMLGSERAKPNPLLLERIKKQINSTSIEVFDKQELISLLVGFIILFLLNIVIVLHQKQKSEIPEIQIEIAEASHKSIINTFQIYD